MEKIAIIDGNSLVFRAYYAIRTPMITTKGIYTHAVYGFLNMLSKALSDIKPDYIAVAFDRKAPTFRHIEYGDYKAGRKKTPEELSMQMPYLKDILDAMNISVLETDGFEADDIIGTLALRAGQSGIEAVVITGDRDELQLVSETTTVLITRKGVSEFEIYDPAAMMGKYGFGPELFVDYKGLMGDQSDNIPGVAGIGEKTAGKLITEFGGIDEIYARIDEVKPDGLRAKLEAGKPLAEMSRRLATIVTNVPIDVDFEEMRMAAWDIPKLTEIFNELEFRKLLSKLSKDTGVGIAGFEPGGDAEVSSAPAARQENDEGRPEIKVEYIDSLLQLVNIESELSGADELVVKFLGSEDHVGNPPVDGIILAYGEKCWIALTAENGELAEAIFRLIAGTGAALSGYALQGDLFKLGRAVLKEEGDRLPRIGFDASVAHYLLMPNAGNSTFAQIMMTHISAIIPEEPVFSENLLSVGEEELRKYAARYVRGICTVRPTLESKLSDEGMLALFTDIELPLVSALAEMELAGFAFAPEKLVSIGAEISDRIGELEMTITDFAGEEFNINSPKQLGDILFGKLGLPGGKKNKNGYSTSADILEKLRGAHPIISPVLEYRTLVKLKGTYIDGLPAFEGEDGKIRAHLRQTVTATGRLSCTDPNLQNIPIRQEPGRMIRQAFVPESDDYVLMGADYSQIELRILAHLSEDPSMIEDFRQEADIHRRTASRVFGVAEDEVSDLQRSNAKAVNFGIVYGMSSFGLSEELGIPVQAAGRYIADYFAKHSAVKEYLDSCIAEVKSKGYSTTIYGRKRPIPEILSSRFPVRQFGERLAMNSPVQGGAADIIKIAMNKVSRRLSSECPENTLILQVHDELILQVKKGSEEKAAKILKEEMEGAAELKVPLVAEIKTASDWYGLK
ncbi:MAG: DNA polymerase I [Clostridiales Family XIII bacterium]|nr:DNA polymerase I [Clostridiales Family XIII bacterium]